MNKPLHLLYISVNYKETLILKELILSYNDITSEGAQDLAKGLQASYDI